MICLPVSVADFEPTYLLDVLQMRVWGGVGHRWELPGNYPVFTVVMVIYHYVE